MPYYIYLVKPFAQLEKLGEHPAFKDASVHAKALRAEAPSAAPGQVKVMFAENEWMAEDLLCQVRERGPSGDD